MAVMWYYRCGKKKLHNKRKNSLGKKQLLIQNTFHDLEKIGIIQRPAQVTAARALTPNH